IVTPLLVPWIALTWGWQWAFIATGSLGFVWLLLWLAVYRSPESNPRVSSDELAHIRSDPPDPANARVPWIRLLGFRQTWAVAAGKLFADPIWWFYLYWLPKFLDARYGIKLAQVALPLIVVYVGVPPAPARSEEHTSELQSRSDLVCRLLLEKKK